MRADWTRPDAAIAAYLRSFGRYGIPFYAVYGPRTPGGQPLPEILTAATVLEALDRAAPEGARTAHADPAAAPRTGG
jgi:suppressor for copper-sensitivity B